MIEQKCELCGTPVKVVGETTKHYEPISPSTSVPKIKWPEKKDTNYYSGSITDEDRNIFNRGFNACLDACRRAYEENGWNQ